MERKGVGEGGGTLYIREVFAGGLERLFPAENIRYVRTSQSRLKSW